MTTKKSSIIASALPNLIHCPRWEGQKESGPAATFGSAFHKAMETGEMKHALTEEAIEAAREGQGFGPSEIEAAFLWASEFLSDLREQYEPIFEQAEVEGELEGRRFFIDYLLVSEIGGKRVAVVIDWKTGRSEYDAITNMQGLAYVHEILKEEAWGIDQCAMMFVTPFTESFSHAVFDRDCISSIRKKLDAVIKEVRDPNSPARPGDVCKYCGLHPCSAVQTSVVKVEKNTIDLVRAQKDPVYMAQLRDLVVPLEKFIKTIKTMANEMRFDRGMELPGYKVVTPSAKTKIENTSAVLMRLMEQLGLDIEEVLGHVTLSVSALEKLVSLGADEGSRGKTLKAFLDHCRDRGWITGGDGKESGSPYLRKEK